MWKSRTAAMLTVVLITSLVAVSRLSAGAPSIAEQRSKLTKAFDDGNYKIAYEGLRKLALDPKNDPLLVGKDLELAVACLYRLVRVSELDDFCEAVIKVHPKNWRLLEAAAEIYAGGYHDGAII